MVFVDDIERLTLENEDYRRVIHTGNYSQLVLMSIPVGEDIELEIHPETDQFFRIEQGEGELKIGYNQDRIHKFKDNFGLVVPSNTYHHIVNTGNVPIKLYTIYSPPQHPPNKVEHVKSPSKEKLSERDKLLLLLMSLW